MKKRLFCFLLAVVIIAGCLSTLAAGTADGTDYSDVPADHWAAAYITQATQLDIINGMGDGIFGLGQNVTRAQFAAMLVRLFDWDLVSPVAPSFSDNQNTGAWYYSAIESAVANGAVIKDSTVFRPDDYITRGDMAVMLVRALGYDTLASSMTGYEMPFTDVTDYADYIMIAYSFGIINGMTSTEFEPGGTATRDQAAAMMIRLYDKYTAKTDWLHGFYAISSSSQMSSISDFDTISFGWSRLEYSVDGGVYLNTTSSNNNEFNFPSGYDWAVQSAQNSAVPTNLNIYLSASQTVTNSNGTVSNACVDILLSAENRSAAVSQIVTQLQSHSFLSGVTIDFEEMSGTELKIGFTAFLKELYTAAEGIGKTVYVCVEPATSDGEYYNAYDYRAIGQNCDKVILMAHDYQATSMPSDLMSAGFTATPLTPIYAVYYALEAITDPVTGVQDISKIALAISFNTEQWQLQNDTVINATPYHPDTSSVYNRLIDAGTTINYSQLFQNPYATFYNSSNDTQNIVWYEDERSIEAKIDLARMFGVNSISIWRLGLIPNYEDSAQREIYYNVLDLLKSGK